MLLRGVCCTAARSSRGGRLQWRLLPRRGRSSWRGAVVSGLDLWRDHAELEFTQEYFALSQDHVVAQLVEALHRQGLVSDKAPLVPQAAPEEADRKGLSKHKDVDPHGLLRSWTDEGAGMNPLPCTSVEITLLQVEAMLKQLRGPVIDLAVPDGAVGADPKLVIVGDTHGQLADVLHIFHEHGTPGPSCTYLFNGDITDRGPEAVEIWMLVLSFKLRFPEHVHVLRGNHENEKLNTRPVKWGGGFSDECNKKYPRHIFNIFNRVFILLPVFAVVQGKIFVVHAGLFRRDGVTLEQLRALPYREHYPEPPTRTKSGAMTRGPWTDDETVLFDAQWADPQSKPGIGSSKRGKYVMAFGPDVTARFLQANDLSLVIRSHEVPKTRRGFDLTHDNQLLTVFSASNYGGLLGNKGAVAVVRRGPPPDAAPAGPLAVEMPGGLSVQCVEHGEDQLQNMAGPGRRQARCVARVLQEFNGSEGAAADEAVRHALGLLSLEKDELELRCNELDVHNQGHLSFGEIVEELTLVCGEFDWGGLLRRAADFGERVQYRNLLAAVKVRWRALGQVQTAALAEAMLRAELNLDSLSDLFDYSQDGQVSPSELRRSLALLLPNLSRSQLSKVQKQFGERELSLSELLQRLMHFLPPMVLEEEWMGGALLHFGQVIQQWAGDGVELHAALLQFYTVFDEDRDGILSQQEVLNAFTVVERERSQAAGRPFLLEERKLVALISQLDVNQNGTISFLEFARAFRRQPVPEGGGQADEDTHPTHNIWTSSIFVHRAALVHCCRLMDATGSGYVSARDFVALVETLGRIQGRPFAAGDLQVLEQSLGGNPLDYDPALGDFSVSFDARLATRMTQSIMMPF